MTVDRAWAEGVARRLEPLFMAAGVGFTRNQMNESAMLWEADPGKFAERYPDSGIIETYGEAQWPSVRCIDFWIYLDRGPDDEILVSFEGWDAPYEQVAVTGDADLDGAKLARMLATHLRLSPPDSPGTD